MKREIVNIFVLLTVLTLSVFTTGVCAEEDAPEASVDVSILTDYVWRGYALSNDSIVIQPSATVTYKGFGINIWGNLDTDLDDGNPATANMAEFNETDITLSYDMSYEDWSFGAGYIYYGLDGAPDTKELYFSVSYDTLLSPSVTVYRDIDEIPGWYVNLGAGHSIPLSGDINLDITGSLSYYSSSDSAELDDSLIPTGDDYSGFHDGLISASVTFPVGKFISITPSLSCSFPLSDSAKNVIRANSMGLFNEDNSTFIYGGITFSMAF